MLSEQVVSASSVGDAPGGEPQRGGDRERARRAGPRARRWRARLLLAPSLALALLAACGGHRSDPPSTGTTSDLRRVMPILAAATHSALATNTGRAREQWLQEDDARVKYVRDAQRLPR